MVRFGRLWDAPFPLLCLFPALFLSSCRQGGVPGGVPTPEARAQALIVNLAGVNPGVAGSLVEGFSAAALERAVGLVVTTGMEEAQWAEGLLKQRWWIPEDPEARLLGAKGVSRVLFEVQRMNPEAGTTSEARQREIREALGKSAAVPDVVEAGPDPGSGHQDPEEGERRGLEDGVLERRAELQDAVQWVQFTQAWSSYYRAAGESPSGRPGSPEGSEVALDQAVTMSLVRPDFLDRLAALMVEGLGS